MPLDCGRDIFAEHARFYKRKWALQRKELRMSWGLQKAGKGEALAKACAEAFASITCPEPEMSIKNGIAAVVDAAVRGSPECAFKIEASGSQYTGVDGKALQNQARLVIEPLYGFVE